MPADNPFAYLLPTPEGLDAQRRAQFLALSQGQDFWARSAGMSGLDLRKSLLEQGIGLSREDQRALNTQAIMSRAQSSLAELVRNGDMDPLDAQEDVIRRTMSDFMAMGDYQSAQALMPGLNQIRDYKLNLDKLRSEATENRAAAFNQTAQGQSRLAVTPSEIQENQASAVQSLATAGAQRGLEASNYALQRLRDRTDPNIRAGGKGPGGEIGVAEAGDVRAMGLGSLNLFDAMYDLSTFMEQAPIVASKTAQAGMEGQQWLSGLKNIFSQRGASVGGFEALSSDPADGIGGSPKSIVAKHLVDMRRKAVQLGFKDITSFESLVIDAAYALARANDPGGRLSNQDFSTAFTALGAVQDRESALKAFRALAKRGYDKFKNLKSTYNPDQWAQFSGMEETIDKSFARFEASYGKSDVKEAAAEAERQRLLNKYPERK